MEDVVTNREKLIIKKFVSAEDERKCKSRIKNEIRKQKLNASMKIDLNSRRFHEMQSKILDEYSRRENIKLLKKFQEKSVKIHENILMHRKVIKQLLEQESKLIRKSKKPKSNVDRMPYLRKVQTKLLESVELSDNEQEEIEMAMPQLFISNKYNGSKLKTSISPTIGKPRYQIY